MGHWQNLLEAVASSPGEKVGELPLLGAAERRQLTEWAGEPALPGAELLHAGFAAVAERQPERVAVVTDEGTPTYGELASGVREITLGNRTTFYRRDVR